MAFPQGPALRAASILARPWGSRCELGTQERANILSTSSPARDPLHLSILSGMRKGYPCGQQSISISSSSKLGSFPEGLGTQSIAQPVCGPGSVPSPAKLEHVIGTRPLDLCPCALEEVISLSITVLTCKVVIIVCNVLKIMPYTESTCNIS